MRQLPRTTPTHSQNVLVSATLVDLLLETAGIQTGDLVYDLGAGRGAISARLARHGCQVVAVELDHLLAGRLRQRFATLPNVRVAACDALDIRLPRQPYKVFSNIPFDRTADILRRLTQSTLPPDDTFLVVQREAAARFIGEPHTTLAALLLFPWFDATVFHRFRRTDFRPVPHVEVDMLRLRKRGPPLLGPSETLLYRDFVVRLFSGPPATLSRRLEHLLGAQRGRRVARALQLGDLSPARMSACRWLELFEVSTRLARDELEWKVAHEERRLRAQQRRLQKVHRTRAHRLRPPPSQHALRFASAR